MRDLTQAELDQRRFSEAWENQSFDAADRVVRSARPAPTLPGVTGSKGAAVPPQKAATFDPLAVGLRLLSAVTVVSRCSCGKRYTLAEFEQLEPRGYAGRLGALSYYDLRTCGGCTEVAARLVERGSSGER